MPCAFSGPGELTDSVLHCLVQNDLNIQADEEFLTIGPLLHGSARCGHLPPLARPPSPPPAQSVSVTGNDNLGDQDEEEEKEDGDEDHMRVSCRVDKKKTE